MDAYAVSKHVGYPPRKVRQLADLVRGQKVDSALTMLRFRNNVESFAATFAASIRIRGKPCATLPRVSAPRLSSNS